MCEVVEIFERESDAVVLSDRLLDTLDAFVRESARTFPFKETTVFRQLLVGLSRDDAGPALFLLDQVRSAILRSFIIVIIILKKN